MVERSERYASEAKPEGHKDSKARARVGVLAAGFWASYSLVRRAPGRREAHLLFTISDLFINCRYIVSLLNDKFIFYFKNR